MKKTVTALTVLAVAISLAACSPAHPTDPVDPPPSGITDIEPIKPVDPEPEETPLWATTFTLPDADEAMQKLIDVYGGAEKVFLLQSGRIARMPCPQGEAIRLNMRYEVGDYAKLILEDCIAEFNDVFEVINPNYKFVINYSPTANDFTEKYSVSMSKSDTLSSSDTREVFGLAHVGYYNNFTELGDFGITMRSDVFDNGSYLMTTFKHELMHLLGAGDAYNNSNATKATIMQSYTVNGYHNFSATDVLFLDALYRNPECPYTQEYIDSYVDNYEKSVTHTQANLTAAVYGMLVQNTSSDDIVKQTNSIGYADTSDFATLVGGGAKRDKTFGSANISFKELAYAVRPETTYFGKFDGDTYWHGAQKETMGSSQGIRYTDYGDGILYAAPNGNLYTIFIKVGNYVILFDRHGSFTALDRLGLTVRTVCSVG